MDNRPLKTVAALLIFLLVLEGLLRAGGAVFLKVQESKNRRMAATGARYVIMCLGDSNTAVGGDDSYPSQLEKMLNARTNKMRFKVVNRGLPAANSTIILNDLEAALAQYKPDMVTAMMGANDRYLPQRSNENILIKIAPFVEAVRVVRLFGGLGAQARAIAQGWFKPKPKEKKFKPVPEEYGRMLFFAEGLKGGGDCVRAEEIFFKLANIPDIEPSFQLRAANDARGCFYARKQYGPLMWALYIALKENEFNVESIDIIRDLTRRREAKDEILGLLTKLVQEKPDSMPLIGLLGACHAQFGNKAMADHYLNILETMRHDGDIVPLKENYIKLTKALRERQIRPVYIQYPIRDVEVLKRMVRAEKDYDNIIFVDNQASFQDALNPERYFDYFTDRNYDDMGHCTPDGNRILASNIADAILTHLQY